MSKHTNVSYQNPKAGKKEMVLGALGMAAGVLYFVSVGGFDAITALIEGGDAQVFWISVGLFGLGFIALLIGKFKHWYANMNYYD